MNKLKAWLDNLHTFLYMLYNPWDVADVVRKIQRDNKPRIRVGSYAYFALIRGEQTQRKVHIYEAKN